MFYSCPMWFLSYGLYFFAIWDVLPEPTLHSNPVKYHLPIFYGSIVNSFWHFIVVPPLGVLQICKRLSQLYWICARKSFRGIWVGAEFLTDIAKTFIFNRRVVFSVNVTRGRNWSLQQYTLNELWIPYPINAHINDTSHLLLILCLSSSTMVLHSHLCIPLSCASSEIQELFHCNFW